MESKTFSIEKAYVISMLFFFHLWPLVEPTLTEEERSLGVYCLFFLVACSGDKCSPEWNESIRRALHIPQEEQRELELSLPEIFSCTLEFCRLHNERYDSKISYAVHLLESMQKNPKNHKVEWAIWQDVIEQVVKKYMNSKSFDWSSEILSWSQ
jgi:uncharacterized protein YdaU (DUF1376 family)